jgi:hypothetical protein
MTKSLLLDRGLWDLTKDAGGNIAVCTEPYRTAQDAACAIKLFRGELWLNTVPGIPYFEQILGHTPSLPFLKSEFVTAALTVPGVASAVCFLDGIANRTVTGQVQITDTDGTRSVVSVGQTGANIFLPG